MKNIPRHISASKSFVSETKKLQTIMGAAALSLVVGCGDGSKNTNESIGVEASQENRTVEQADITVNGGEEIVNPDTQVTSTDNYDYYVVQGGQSNGLGHTTETNGIGDAPRPGLDALQLDGTVENADKCNQVWWKDIYGSEYPKGYRCNISVLHEIGEGILEKDPGKTVLMTQTGQPGNGIRTWDDGTAVYQNLIAHIRKGLPSNAIQNSDFKVYFTFPQGENNHGEDKEWFAGKITNLHERLIRDLGVRVIFIGNSSPFVPDNNFQFHATKFGGSMNSVFEALASDGNPDTCYANQENIPTLFDNTHYTASGNDIAGRNVADIIINFEYGSDARCD